MTVATARYEVSAVLDTAGQVVRGPSEIVVTDGVITRIASVATSSRLIALPPLVNSHDHGRGTGCSAAGIADAPLEMWLPQLSGDHRPQHQLVREATEMMAHNGIGASVLCVNPTTPDIADEVRIAARAVTDVGLRAAVVVPIVDVWGRLRRRDETGWTRSEITTRLRMVDQLRDELAGPCIDVQLGPSGPQWVSEETLRAVADHAQARGMGVHMHLLESRAQRIWADDTYPEGLLHWLDQIGLLGPHTTFAHGTQLRDDELTLLTERGCVLVLNASSNLRLASGFAPAAAAAHARVRTAMGLDGLTLDDDNDPWSELRLLRGIWQAQTGEKVPAAQLICLAAATSALGTARPEPIAEHRLADFVVVDVGGHRELLDRWSVDEVLLAGPLTVHANWVAGRNLCATGDVETDRISIGG